MKYAIVFHLAEHSMRRQLGSFPNPAGKYVATYECESFSDAIKRAAKAVAHDCLGVEIYPVTQELDDK